jgi:hypothetical protein
MKKITFQYNFNASDLSEVFDLHLDAQKLELIFTPPNPCPTWANLEFHQCPNCPLSVQTHSYCPLAINMVSIVKRFQHILSFNEIHLKVVTDERTLSQDTTAQRAISSLMGFVIAASGCPHTSLLKPMVRFHLPLSTEIETIYRTTSMYMLAQYFLRKDGKAADLELSGLNDFYQNLHVVNKTIAERLRAASDADSVVNAIILLDLYAKALPCVIEESLDEIRYLFTSYF